MEYKNAQQISIYTLRETSTVATQSKNQVTDNSVITTED